MLRILFLKDKQHLSEKCVHVYLDADLFELLQVPVYRNKISEVLFETYINQVRNKC